MDEFGEFFAQMPPGLVANICTIFVGLALMMVYFGYIKPARQHRKRQAELRALQAAQAASAADQPDLAQLVGSGGAMYDDDPTLLLGRNTPTAPRRQGEHTVQMRDGSSARAVEVLAILRDAENRLIVQLDGLGYRTLAADPQARARFTALMQELAQTVNTPVSGDSPTILAAQARPSPTPTPTTERMPAVPPADAPDADDSDALTEPDLDFPDLDALSAPPPPPPPISGVMPGDLPKIQSDPQIRHGGFLRPAKIESEPVPEINLAASIEAYLQYKLYHAGVFSGRSIHVHPAVHGGVVIQVDREYFDSVADISDPEVRAFIAEAIEEWQARQ